MAPRVTRRRVLSGITLSSFTALAGCTARSTPAREGTNTSQPTAEKTKPPATDPTDTEERRTDTQATETPELDTAEDALRGFIETSTQTDDPERLGAYFHPVHPFHPDNVEADVMEQGFPREMEISDIAFEQVEQEATADIVLSAPLLRTADISEQTVADALTAGESEILRTEITRSNGETINYHAVTVAVDGRWTILARGVNPKLGDPLEVFVVDEVVFDSDEERARVQFISSPTADSVEVTAKETSSTSRTDDPTSESSLDVAVDPDGDEVVVTATVDDQSRTVHREQYPKSTRAVDEVTFETEPEGELFDAVGTVTFTGNQQGEKLVVESTIESGKTTFDTVESVSEGSVPISPEGDELTVTITRDGKSTEVHRERYHPR